jgi:hypothetical protein
MLMALLNDILDLSKIEAGKFGISPSETDIMHILRRVLRLWRPKASEKNLNLTLAFDSDMPTHVMIDSVRLQQCVSNLISNAIKFTDSGGVSLRAGVKNVEDGEYLIEISVTDTGCGMDEEDASQLFQPFHQVDDTISRRHGGTGLGLSITKKLAELMGGTATVKSALGRGSIFTVSFRAKHATRGVDGAASIPPLRNAAHEARKVSNLRVLLVDDHPINRQIVQLFLRSYKMNITEAVNGREALDALERDIFDLVLLDMHMPVMDGPTMVQKIRSSRKPYASLPVIALTADAMSGDKERYLGMGMNGYLAKPLSERDLLSEIIRVVEADRRLDHAKSETKTVA